MFSAGSRIEETSPAGENWKRILHIPVLVDFNVDNVFISMNSQEAASRMDAVELVGYADLFHDALIYWRVPLVAVAYTGLVLSPENRLFTIRPEDGFLVELDPITGLEIASIPLKSAEYIDALPVELTIDDEGIFYVLFEWNEGITAIAVLDPHEAMARRVGVLTLPGAGDWTEGSYYKPRSIAVTHDEQFALTVDGDVGSYYLTCILCADPFSNPLTKKP